MSEPQGHETSGSKGRGSERKAAADERPRDAKAEQATRTREQMVLLTAASWCTKPHHVRPTRPDSFSPALEERRKAAAELRLEDIEGDRHCDECQSKLSQMAAGLVLAVLPPTPTPELLAAARRLRVEQPMVWSAIRRGNPVLLSQTLRRCGKQHFSSSEYQQLASDAIAAMHAARAA